MAYTTINKGSSYFNTVLYTGNGSIQSITGVGFKPDLIWVKGRSSQVVNWHGLFDSVRGTAGGALSSNLANAEPLETNLSSFNSNGFTFSNAGNFDNTSTVTFVSWNWLASNTTVSNTVGSTTSIVSANTTAGFSIVSYTGNGITTSIGTGLTTAPKMIIIKSRSQASSDWIVYHASVGTNDYLKLNSTAASTSQGGWINVANNFIILGTAPNYVNTNGSTYIAYCFSEVKGYSKFGSYTGNGSTDGPFIYTGFKPRWIMVKSTGDTGGWTIMDTSRIGYNASNYTLYAEATTAEQGYLPIDILSNGFKLRIVSTGTSFNSNTINYIYMAFAENPFVTSGGIPVTAR